ncbi:MAG: aspartate kinase, partial [Rhodothermales bacterium]
SNWDAILAAGERMSVPLLSLALCEAGLRAEPFDATQLVRTDDSFGQAQVDVQETYRLVRTWHGGLDPELIAVVTGFIGSTEDGRVTTLGRGGSDYSAALLACALEAEALERWTDVDGLYTWDPRKRCGARQLATIVLSEAVAWNRAGRLGMHRKALDPIVAASIPVYVRSTFLPEHPGTVILPQAE